MKKTFKALLILIIFSAFFISLLYGLRIRNTQYKYEYLTNSLVVTIPNRLWFETNSQQDYFLKDNSKTFIFENSSLTYSKSGYDIGNMYPTYTAEISNDIASKTDIATREKNTLKIDRTITIPNATTYSSYISKIAFSEYGQYSNNNFNQEGCNIHTSSEKGSVTYDNEISAILISYPLDESIGEIKDTINITIECK